MHRGIKAKSEVLDVIKEEVIIGLRAALAFVEGNRYSGCSAFNVPVLYTSWSARAHASRQSSAAERACIEQEGGVALVQHERTSS